MDQLTCIVCPRGCLLKVEMGETIKISGNKCSKGREFAEKEATNPTRVVTSTVKTNFIHQPRISVRTQGEIPKNKIKEVIEAINKVVIEKKIGIGEVIVENIANTGIHLIATMDMIQFEKEEYVSETVCAGY